MRKLFPGTARIVVCLLFAATIGSAQTHTPEELVTQVLKAFEAKDRPSLKALAISTDEVKKFVWPAIAANVAGPGMNADKFSATYSQSSDLGISTALNELGGRKWQVVKVAMDAPQKQSKTYRLFPAPMVTIRDESGQEKTIRIVGGLLEQGGAYKVTTYYLTTGKQ